MEKNTPRPHSPHMDNEEPIGMAHYPGAQQPDPGEVPPIEREDFPAPPYPYAVEELKRRLSSSSIENDEDDDDSEIYGQAPRVDEEKVKRTVEALHHIDKDSSIAAVFKQNLEESQKKQRLPLHWDPRNASRTPSAKKMPHLRFRYDTPINACTAFWICQKYYKVNPLFTKFFILVFYFSILTMLNVCMYIDLVL